MFRLATKCISKPTLLTLCTRNPSMTGGFLAQRVSKHVNHFEDGYDISNHCSFSSIFRLTTKCTSKPTLLTLCTRNSSMTGGFLAQRVSKHVNQFKDEYGISRSLFPGPQTCVCGTGGNKGQHKGQPHTLDIHTKTRGLGGQFGVDQLPDEAVFQRESTQYISLWGYSVWFLASGESSSGSGERWGETAAQHYPAFSLACRWRPRPPAAAAWWSSVCWEESELL